jgi:hypothetical protein
MDTDTASTMSRAQASHHIWFMFAVVLATTSLWAAYGYYSNSLRTLTDEAARSSTEAANDDVVELVSNVMAAEALELLNAYDGSLASMDWDALSQTTVFGQFDQDARRLMLGTRILKIKLYAKDGMTVYSTDLLQLGADYSEREDVIHALRGRPSSETIQRDFFEAFTEDIQNATIVTSYHPFKDPSGRIVGVMEVYADRTAEFEQVQLGLLSAKGMYLFYLSGFAFIALGPLAFSIYARPPR